MECVFPMVVVSILPNAEFVKNDHRKHPPHFKGYKYDPRLIWWVWIIIWIRFWNYNLESMLMLVMILKETKLRNYSCRCVPYRSNILGLWFSIKSYASQKDLKLMVAPTHLPEGRSWLVWNSPSKYIQFDIFLRRVRLY